MSGLSREILKWLQGLDLSFSIKVPKRDFSNGFLVAEILNRYYPQDVLMHSFDNNSAAIRKQDNWQQLKKFFRRKGFNVTDDLCHKTMHSHAGSAVALIELLYTNLTNRSVQVTRPPPAENNLPGFARPTVTSLVREKMAEGIVAFEKDQDVVLQTTHDTMMTQKINNRMARVNEPERFIPRKMTTNVLSNTQPLGDLRRTRMEANQSQAQIEPVRHVVAQLQPGMAQSQSKLQSRDGRTSEALMPAMTSSFGQLQQSPPVQSSDQIFEDCVADGLEGIEVKGLELYATLDPSKDRMLSFLDVADTFPTDISGKVFQCIESRAQDFTNSFLSSPKEFWKFMATVHIGLVTLDTAGPNFRFLQKCISAVGGAAVAADGLMVATLAADYAVPRLLPVIRTSPSRREACCRIILSFADSTDSSSVIKVVKLLQEGLKSLDIFVPTLTSIIDILATRGLSPDLIDLFSYYAEVGLKVASPSTRAAAVGLIRGLCVADIAACIPLLPRLVTVSRDQWWVLRAEILRVCGAVLPALAADDESAVLVYDLVKFILNPTAATPATIKIGLAMITPHLRSHPALTSVFIDSVLMLPDAVRDDLLGETGQPAPIEVLGSSPLNGLQIPSLPSIWHSLSVARAAVSVTAQMENEALDPDVAILLAKVVAAPMQEAERSEWLEVFVALKDFFYAALGDPEVVDSATFCLTKFISFLETDAMRTLPTLLSSLHLVYGSAGDPQCQETVLEWMREGLTGNDATIKPGLVSVVKSFTPELLTSPLAQLVHLAQ